MHRSRPPSLFSSLLVILAALAGAAANARADDDQAGTYAVQNRAFALRHELHAEVGILPINAFDKGITVGGGYTYHFNDLWAWEVASFEYVSNVDTGIKMQLLQNFKVDPTSIEQLNWFASSNVVVKPLYGKFAFLNRSVLHAELYLVAGVGVGKYIDPDAFRVAGDLGLGIRFHLAQHVSLRVDIRDFAFFGSANNAITSSDELFINVSLGVSFGGGNR